MNYQIVGTRMVAGVNPGGKLSEQQIEAAGASVSHLIASGHIAPVVKASKKAASFTPADEADTEEII